METIAPAQLNERTLVAIAMRTVPLREATGFARRSDAFVLLVLAFSTMHAGMKKNRG
ncbi:MAG TPA: hypothetical protein VJS42_15275 [Steroidobacteraceae bacterium]|nr:hypothetical protein [Steroidobacteraceae bacterium]